MSSNPQTESSFVSRLPREVRDAIYLELWRSCGLRQHILRLGNMTNSRFYHWQCTMEFDVHDRLQRDIEELRAQLCIPLGQKITRRHDERSTIYGRRLQSPWMNHWPCGERAQKEHGFEAVWGPYTSTIPCWLNSPKKNEQGDDGSRLSPYIPMLLSCKFM